MMKKMVGFLTDFGLMDPYVGQVKSVMLSINPQLEIVDLGHLIEPFCITCGAYSVYSSYKYFPEGSGLLVVVDPGVGSSRKALIAEAFGRVFVGPDNGVLWQVLNDDGQSKVYEIDQSSIKLDWPVSSTFHGRDLFGPALALALKEGVERVAGERLRLQDIVKLPLRMVEEKDGRRCLRIVYVDRFGNIALSATRDDIVLPGEGSYVKAYGPRGQFVARVSPSFSLVPVGDMALYFNSFDFLELAVNQASAAEVLGARVGDMICLENME